MGYSAFPSIMHTAVASDQLVLTASLLRAIEEHKYLKSCESCRELEFLDAARDFREKHEEAWLRERARADAAEQVHEMRKHLWIESEKAGRDLGRTTAGTDWVARHARSWRMQRESLCANGLADLEARCATGLSGAALDELLAEIGRLFCDVFVSQPGIGRPDFSLIAEAGAPAIPVLAFRPSRRRELAQLHIDPGAALRFIAYGRDATRALAAIAAALAAE